MSVKEIAGKTIEDLPDDADWEEVIERITLNSAMSREPAEEKMMIKGVPSPPALFAFKRWCYALG